MHSYGILGPFHLFPIRKVRQEDSRRVCWQNMPSGKELLILCAATCMERYGRNRKEVNEESFEEGLKALLEQNSSLFIQQTEGLTTYQLNFIRLLCKDIHSGFTTQAVSEIYPLGSKSNIDRIKKSLVDKEIITVEKMVYSLLIVYLNFGLKEK